jgi:Neuraminidase (sialidase)
MKTIKKIIALILCAAILMSCVGVVSASAQNETTQNSIFDFSKVTDFFQNIIAKIKDFFNKIAGFFVKDNFTGSDYTIPILDLSALPDDLNGTKYEYLYELTVVDNSQDYMAHPDSVLLRNGNILTVYPAGHGKGAVLNKISTDNGLSWSEKIDNTPVSWVNSQETPTIYRLEFADGTPDKLILISANPKWPNFSTTGGFECSISEDEGKTWSEFKRFYDLESDNAVVPIVAMASLTRLKENGEFTDKWMGIFHDADFYNYKTILTFDKNGNMQWSKPEKFLAEHRDIEKSAQMCEIEIIRSDKGVGDELCLIARSQSKKINSMIAFSSDEGKTWSEPKEAPSALNGERHKADYTSDGRLFITFRSIERGSKASLYAKAADRTKGWMSEGLIAWVGTYEDLRNGREGDYRIKIAHIYNDDQTQPEYYANADTGYCGNVVLSDDTIVTSSYGKYSPAEKSSDGKALKTYIASKRINLKDTDALVERYFGR